MPSPQKTSITKVASIILAGGKGTRLYPLTHNKCKPFVCFGGRYRLIDIPISNSLNANIERIFVISQYFAASLQQHILETYKLDTFRHTQIQILSPEETSAEPVFFKGTADAIRQNMTHFNETEADYFLILSGDQLYNIDFRDIIEFAKESNKDLTIASIPVERKEAERMGLLQIDKNNAILQFIEKPKDPALLEGFSLSKENLTGHHLFHRDEPHYLASMGIYIFKRKALIDLMKQVGDDFGKDLIPLCVQQGQAVSYVYKGYWEDIGTIKSYYEANLALLSELHCLNTYDQLNPIFTHPHTYPSPFIKNTVIHNTIISQGSIIHAKEITSSIIGVNIHIGKESIIRNSIVLGSLLHPPSRQGQRNIGHHCVIKNAIIDENAYIGNHVELTNSAGLETFDGEGIFIREGIIIVPSGSILPDKFSI